MKGHEYSVLLEGWIMEKEVGRWISSGGMHVGDYFKDLIENPKPSYLHPGY